MCARKRFSFLLHFIVELFDLYLVCYWPFCVFSCICVIETTFWLLLISSSCEVHWPLSVTTLQYSFPKISVTVCLCRDGDRLLAVVNLIYPVHSTVLLTLFWFHLISPWRLVFHPFHLWSLCLCAFCPQGPLRNTCGHFWLMIWEQKTKAVIMLNRVIEKGSVSRH